MKSISLLHCITGGGLPDPVVRNQPWRPEPRAVHQKPDHPQVDLRQAPLSGGQQGRVCGSRPEEGLPGHQHHCESQGSTY